nr:AbrB family transcriptional regulator [Cochlodiniinecator piscidefendens]
MKTIYELALTLALAGVGAIVFSLIGFPAAVLTGSAVAVTLGGIFGAPVIMPTHVRDVCFVALGVGIGASVTPEVLRAAATWPLSFVMLSLALLLSMFTNRFLLRRFFGFSGFNATLASAPGHLSYILGIAAEDGRELTRISVVQSTRVLFLTICVPPIIFGIFGVTGETFLPPFVMSLTSGIGLGIAAGAVGFLFKRFQIPAAFLLAGMFVSAVGHLMGATPGRIPDWLAFAAYLVMGALIGTRFRGVTLPVLLGAVWAGVWVTLVTVTAAGLGVVGVMFMLGLSPGLLFVAFAPGGVEAMAAIAVQAGLDPTFVAAHHVFRLVFLTFAVPIFLRGAKI